MLNIGLAMLFVCDKKNPIARGNIQLYIIIMAKIDRIIAIEKADMAIFFSCLYKLGDKNLYMQYKNTGKDIRKEEYRHSLISVKNSSQMLVKINISSVDRWCNL